MGFVLKFWLYGFPIETTYDVPIWEVFNLHYLQKKVLSIHIEGLRKLSVSV